MRQKKNTLQYVSALTILALSLSILPIDLPIGLPSAFDANAGGMLLASTEAPMRVYTFTEVGQIAQNNSPDIIRQKGSVDQADYNRESLLTNYQMQVYEFYSGGESNITEDMLLGLQDSYEDAFNRYIDAEETLEKLKPKVAYQAQKLYIDILLTEAQIQIQAQEILRLRDEYVLAEVKAAFGSISPTQLRNAKAQWDEAVDSLENMQSTLNNSKNTMREYLNIPDTREFVLENPPNIGQYAQVFDAEEVREAALKNSLALKQAKREVDEIGERIQRYEIYGERDRAAQLAAGGRNADLAYKETRLSLERTVESAIKDFHDLKTAEEKAKESLTEAGRSLVTTQVKLHMGIATVGEVKQAEKAVLTAERALSQAQYNYYLGAKRLILLKEGILVN